MRCPSCSTEVAVDASYCPSCGAALAQAGAYGVELREVATLAIDIQGLAKLLGQISTAHVSKYVAECMSALEGAVAAHGGTVINRHSAGLTAIFGAPVAREREVELAVRAAFAVRESIAAISVRLRGAGGQNLTTRFAVDCGLVRVGAFVAASDYVALGAPVENAARLRNSARPNTVLLSAAAADHVKTLFKLKPVALGATGADGRAESGYLVDGFVDSLTKAEASRSAFVGRRGELEKLRRLREEVRKGRGAAVGVSGKPGIGKSRLVQEALAGAADVRVCAVRCLPVTTEVPYAAFRNILNCLLASFPGAGPLEKAGNIIRESAPELSDALPLLAVILDPRAVEASRLEQVEGVARPEKLLELVAAIFARFAAGGPAALVFEDVQWASNSDLSLLEGVARATSTMPLLLVVTARDEERLRPVATEILRLGPLSDEDVEKLVRESVPRERLNPELLRRITEWAEGSPLYCDEIGAAIGSGDVDAAFRPPATVKAAARARADKLSAEALRLAKVAACVGLEADVELVKAVAPPGTSKDFDAWLAELEREGIVRVSDGRLVFVHEIIGNVLYESLIKKERVAKLAEIARAARARRAEPGVVAHYLLEAGRSREAVEYLKEAGDRAAAVYSLLEAISHYSRALENLRDAGPVDIGLRFDIIERLASALLDYSAPSQALELIEGELKYAETPTVRAKLLFLAGRAYGELSENRKALLYLEDARNIYHTLNDALMEGKTLQTIVRVLMFLGEHGRRRKAIAEALARFTEAGDDVGVAYCYNIIGSDYLNADEPARALEYFQDALYIWQQSRDLPGQAIALTNLGYGYYLMGRYAEAVEFAERALEITRRIGTRRTRAAAACNLVAYYLYLNPARAEEYGREALELAADMQDYEILAGAHINLGELERSRASWDAAREHVAAATAAARKIGSDSYVFYAGLLGAKVALGAGNHDSEEFQRYYEAISAVSPPSRETAALVRANLDADLALVRKDVARAKQLAVELKARVAAAKKAEEIHEGHLRLGELYLFLGDPHAAQAEFEWVMRQTEGSNFLFWPRAAFGCAQVSAMLGRREEARERLARAEEVFGKYNWLYWTDRVAQFRVEAEL
ncbi:MAG TPA: AAA family ATPase [bacterium]|nr:AAA family ATPase [bacterium]